MQCRLQGADRYDPRLRGLSGEGSAIESRSPFAFDRLASFRPRQRGQSLVEFALIVPILLMLLVGIADLGRVFAASIVVESSTRNAAEIAAQQYLRDFPTWPPASPVPSGYYSDLHLKAARAVCAETRGLPNSSYSGGSCPDMPIVAVCVHDGTDDACNSEPFGASIPPECGDLSSWPTNDPPSGAEPSRYVEVRVCYHFSMLTQVPFISFQDFFIQRTRTFTVADY
jgi:hypothetical protein